MYRILIADDESIVRESLKFIIKQRHEDNCEIECAKTGRGVIELAETFRPDIAFMDIHMPGINGIEAMKEIRKQNESVIFIVMTAFDKFDYAKESINIGVLEYLSKPAARESIEAALSRAMGIIDKRREIRSQDLTIKEKLETVIPYIERGLIYTMLINDDGNEAIAKYRELLGIDEEYAYVMVAEARQNYDKNDANLVGSSIRLEDHYELVKESIKDECYCIVGPVMTNKVIILVPYQSKSMEYEDRTVLVDKVRGMLHRLEDMVNIDLKIGIGNVKTFDKLQESYHEATASLGMGIGSVLHASDLKVGVSYEEDYPAETENKIFAAVERGDVDTAVAEANFFFNWMTSCHGDRLEDIRVKVIDFVLWAEHIAYIKANMFYRFSSRTDYLSFICSCSDMTKLRSWFVEKISISAENVSKALNDVQKTPVDKAIAYLNENYAEDLSLERMSQIIGISSYYFSKLFKVETGTTFVDYLTDLRMTKASELLAFGKGTVKDVSSAVGYVDANYFSRIFKKRFGVSPSEYKVN